MPKVSIYKIGTEIKIVAPKQRNTDATYDYAPIVEASARASLARTRRTVGNVAVANQWEIFCTITVADVDGKVPTFEDAKSIIGKRLRALKRKAPAIAYYGVMELGDANEEAPDAMGRWHTHMLMRGIPPEWLTHYAADEPCQPRIAYARLARGIDCGTIPSMGEGIGFVFFEKIWDAENLAAYLSKHFYLGKADNFPKGARRTFRSHGLASEIKIWSGDISDEKYRALRRTAMTTEDNKWFEITRIIDENTKSFTLFD